MTIYTPPIQNDPTVGLRDLQAPFWDSIAATAEDAFYHNPTNAIGRILGLQAARMGSIGAPIPAEELNQRYGALGLNFDRPERAGAVAVIVRRKQEELARRETLARGPQGLGTGAAQLLTGLAVSAADPLNVASAFVPIVPEARYAIWAERFGKTGARLARGAVEGAAGAALVEPLVYGAAALDQSDYGLLDSFLNVTFGAVLGGGLHAGFGKLSEMLGRVDPRVREGALRAAVAQAAEGRPVDINHVLSTDPRWRGGEVAHDPMDPRFIPELNTRERPPPARNFDLGPVLGEGKGEKFVNYSRIAPEDMRIMEELNTELQGTEGGHRLIQDNPFGPGQDVIGMKGTTPEWFTRLNEEADVNRRARRKALKKARREMSQEDVKAGDFGPETILTRDKVANVVRKLKNREPLGREEGDIAKAVWGVARDMREERVRAILDYRDQRVRESEAEIDAYVSREMEAMGGHRPLAPDDAEGVRAADEAVAQTSKEPESLSPEAETLDQELTDLTGEIDALHKQGALTDADVAGIDRGLEAEDVKAHQDAALAAARCLLIHP